MRAISSAELFFKEGSTPHASGHGWMFNAANYTNLNFPLIEVFMSSKQLFI